MAVGDPWAQPRPEQLKRAGTAQAAEAGKPWQRLPQMSLRSVPDSRTAVPLVWWLPVLAVVVLTVTTVAILPGTGSVAVLLVAVVVSVVGYALAWWRIRPGRLRTGPHLWPNIEAVAQDRTDPPTVALPAINAARRTGGRAGPMLLTSAAVALGASFAWSILSSLVIHRTTVPGLSRARTVLGGLTRAVANAALTSVLEECGIALVILAVAGLAQRFLPARFDTRAVAVIAILAATAVRTGLHVPLWGVGAVARVGLSFVLAWLFWRTRRIWPLITVHILWDTLAIQAAVSPSLRLRSWCALALLGWGITGVTMTIIALRRSHANTRRAAQYYRRSAPQQ